MVAEEAELLLDVGFLLARGLLTLASDFARRGRGAVAAIVRRGFAAIWRRGFAAIGRRGVAAIGRGEERLGLGFGFFLFVFWFFALIVF